MTERPNLVLVPGLMCSPLLFQAQIDALAGAATVQIADVTRCSSLTEMARHVLRAAPPRFALAGLSMGGYVAFEMLRQAPERITRLALLDTNARADRPDQIKVREVLIGLARTMGARAVQGLLLRLLIHPSRLQDADLTGRVLDMAEWVGPVAFERQQRAIMARSDNRGFLTSIRCPTLILVGREDQLTPVKVHEEMAAAIPGSRLEIIADCGHLATMERPAAVNALLGSWLAASST